MAEHRYRAAVLKVMDGAPVAQGGPSSRGLAAVGVHLARAVPGRWPGRSGRQVAPPPCLPTPGARRGRGPALRTATLLIHGGVPAPPHRPRARTAWPGATRHHGRRVPGQRPRVQARHRDRRPLPVHCVRRAVRPRGVHHLRRGHVRLRSAVGRADRQRKAVHRQVHQAVPAEELFERICRENGITARPTKPRSPTTIGQDRVVEGPAVARAVVDDEGQ